VRKKGDPRKVTHRNTNVSVTTVSAILEHSKESDVSSHIISCKDEDASKLKGTKSGGARLGRMKRGRGMNDRDDKSNGIEIPMTDALPKINPTDPLILA